MGFFDDEIAKFISIILSPFMYIFSIIGIIPVYLFLQVLGEEPKSLKRTWDENIGSCAGVGFLIFLGIVFVYVNYF